MRWNKRVQNLHRRVRPKQAWFAPRTQSNLPLYDSSTHTRPTPTGVGGLKFFAQYDRFSSRCTNVVLVHLRCIDTHTHTRTLELPPTLLPRQKSALSKAIAGLELLRAAAALTIHASNPYKTLCYREFTRLSYWTAVNLQACPMVNRTLRSVYTRQPPRPLSQRYSMAPQYTIVHSPSCFVIDTLHRTPLRTIRFVCFTPAT